MGCRSCDKPKMNYRKGLWSPEEDQRLRDYILKHGLGCWSAVPAKAGLQRNGKSCRLRWINYLRPGLKRGMFSQEEEDVVINLQAKLGNKWSQIAMHLPGRTDNEVKNYWNSYLKKRVMQLGSNPASKNASPELLTSMSANTELIMTGGGGGSTATSTHDHDGNIGSSGAVSAAEPFVDHQHEHQHQHHQQQAKNYVFADWMPTAAAVTPAGPESYSMSAHWPASTASSGNVTPSHGAFVGDQMSATSYGALQHPHQHHQQQEHHHHHHGSTAGVGAHGATAGMVAGGGYFDLLNMGDIYGGFTTTNDDLLF